MKNDSRTVKIFVVLAWLATGACAVEEDFSCVGSGQEILRCRAERSGEAEAQELVELLLDSQPPVGGH